MLSNPEGFNDNIPMSPGTYMTFKKTSSRKTLNQFSEVLDVNQKTPVGRLGDAKSKRKRITSGSMLWFSITKRLGH